MIGSWFERMDKKYSWFGGVAVLVICMSFAATFGLIILAIVLAERSAEIDSWYYIALGQECEIDPLVCVDSAEMLADAKITRAEYDEIFYRRNVRRAEAAKEEADGVRAKLNQAKGKK